MSVSLCLAGVCVGGVVPWKLVESLCCREVSAFWSLVEELTPRPADVTCLTQHPGFEACCLNPFVLKIAYTHFRQDHGPLQASTHEYVHGLCLLYKSFYTESFEPTVIGDRRCVAYTINMHKKQA